jgi:hypothetical protein
MGVEATREFTVEFQDGNRAQVTIHDRVQSTAERRYAWQMNLGAHNSDGGIRAGPGFVLTGERGEVRGAVRAPSSARILPGDPFRVEVEAGVLDLRVELQLEPRSKAAR